MPNYSVLIVAAGQSTRFENLSDKKPFVVVRQKAVWLHSAEMFRQRNDIQQMIVVIASEDAADFRSRFRTPLETLGIEVVLGGAERADSVENGLQRVQSTAEFVVIHDAARPCIDAELIERVFVAAAKFGAAVPAIPISSTIKRSGGGQYIDETVDRTDLFLAQTPQVFRRETILQLYANRNGISFTDESQLAERNGIPVALVEGSPLNLKITTKQDLALAAACLETMVTMRFDAPTHPRMDNTHYH